MNASQVNKMKAGSPIVGTGLLLTKKTVTFSLSGNMVDNRKTTKNVAVSGSYFVDAAYRMSGTTSQSQRPWFMAPRSAYLTAEGISPLPRFYLYMESKYDHIEVSLVEVTLNGTVTISGSYTITVDVWVYSSS